MLLHSGPLGLAHRMLNVEPLPFGSVSTEDRELMQLKTVSEGHPCVWTPSFGNFTIYSSPRVMLVHLVATQSYWDCDQTGGSSAAHTSWLLPCHEPSGILGASVGSAQSPPCGPPRQHPTRQCPWTQRILGDSTMPLTASQQPFQASCTLRLAPSA
jgi:hypothetical protein